MNTFADSLFKALFGWARSLVQGVWSAVVNRNFSSFFSWLVDHWFWLVLGLCLIGTAIDFIIWLIRWRPYLVWRTNMRKLFRRLRGETDGQQDFETGYTAGVALDMLEENIPEQQYAPEPAAEMPSPQPVVFPEEFYAPRYTAVNDPPPAPAQYVPPEENYAPIVTAPKEEAYQPLPGVAPRRRRSDKHIQQKKASWHERLVADEAEQDGMLDGLPPAVDREQAFHAPVYPQGSNQYSAWKKPENHQTNGSVL